MIDVDPKTIRLATGALLLVVACQDTTTIPVRVLLPADRSALERTNNVHLDLVPDGISESLAVDGLDFAIEVEVDPSSDPRQLSLYLARDEDLLAWGKTAPAVLTGLDEVALFVGPPGELAQVSESAVLDGELLGAAARGRGAVFVEAPGSTLFFDEITFATYPGVDLTSVIEDPPPLDKGGLISDPLGGVMRVDWTEDLVGYRYDPADNQWIELTFEDGDPGGQRPGAAHLLDAAAEHLLLFGGGERTDVVAIDLLPGDEAALAVDVIDGVELDGARPGAVAAWVTRPETDEGEVVLLTGGDDPALPLVHVVQDERSGGTPTPWRGQACGQVELEADEDATIRVLCFGGRRSEEATAAAFVVEVPARAADPIEVTILEDFLPVAMADPRIFSDQSALYAQGASHLVRIDREDLDVTEIATDTLRETGGVTVSLGTGVTVLVGGETAEQEEVDSWQIFTPVVPAR